MSSHLSNLLFLCLLFKNLTHKLRLHWLPSTPAQPITITYIHRRPMTKIYVHFNEVKLRRRTPSPGTLHPTYKELCRAPAPLPSQPTIRELLACKHNTEEQSVKESTAKITCEREKLKQDKTLHSSTKVFNFTTSRIFFLNISFLPITPTNQINKKANIKLALRLEGAATISWFYRLLTNVCLFVVCLKVL